MNSKLPTLITLDLEIDSLQTMSTSAYEIILLLVFYESVIAKFINFINLHGFHRDLKTRFFLTEVHDNFRHSKVT